VTGAVNKEDEGQEKNWILNVSRLPESASELKLQDPNRSPTITCVAIQTLYNIKLVDNKRRFEAHEPEMNDLSTRPFQLWTENA
jgi:hypothetical protein